MKKVLFFHGLESTPSGNKATWLKDNYGALTPALPTKKGLAASVAAARKAIAQFQPDLVVGSSFGGAVALTLLNDGTLNVPMVLIAPAARKLEAPNTLPADARVVVLHGENDETVPLDDSRALIETGGDGALLHIVRGPQGDHRLNCILENGLLERAIEHLGG
jgi:pimeloyl-ACP methyl ester carboxylesterase